MIDMCHVGEPSHLHHKWDEAFNYGLKDEAC